MPAPAAGQSHPSHPQPRLRIAAVRYLNTVPLICGLDGRADVELTRAAPADLLEALLSDRADVALIPVIDLQRSSQPLVVLPAGCIASAGETLTVRVFARRRPQEVHVLAADAESHTSVALAAVLWAEQHGSRLEIVPRDAYAAGRADAVLLIGDKVVTDPPACLHQADLGQMWFEMTRLPFVFAVWAARDSADHPRLYDTLLSSRQGCADRLEALASQNGPLYGWPADLARRYVTRHLQYDFSPACRQGMELFHNLACRHGLIPSVHALKYHE